MPERFQTEKYEDRSSSKVGVKEYFTQHMGWMLLPFVGGLAGFALRKVTKLPFLEGKGGLMVKMLPKSTFGATAEEFEKNPFILRTGESLGAEAGGFISAAHLWSGKTKQELQVDQTAQAVTDLRGMESANTYLANENEELRAQIRFADKHPPRGAGHVETAAAKAEMPEQAHR